MRIAKVNSYLIENTRRIIKVFNRGFKDVQTHYQVSQWGDDSNPIQNTDSIVSDTANDESSVVLGYINLNAKSKPGEKRIYATDTDGNEVFDIYLKNDGTAEINGTGDYLVKYSGLETSFNELQSTVNDLVTAFNAHGHASFGAPPTTVPGVIPASESSANIEDSKINEIKTGL